MRSRADTPRPFTCATCEVEILGPATFHVGLAFCCAGCIADGPCICSYDADSPVSIRIRHCLDVAGALELRLTGPVADGEPVAFRS